MDTEFLGMFMAVVGAATVFFDCVFLYDWATVRFRRPTKKAASLSRGDESDLLTGFLFGDVALHPTQRRQSKLLVFDPLSP